MKKIVIAVLILMALQMHAQTGIGTTTPNSSAKLDVYSTNKGFLPPRVTLASVSDATTITSPAEGLLVYNLGSSGLQSGYYYWNGANWATIATANSAGNGVTSSDLVKLYSKAYSTASGDIANTNGYSFTVPVSGRYLFDFTSSGYASGAYATMTFKVRQGTTDLATDAQSSLNNTVHVEYNGKVEVNLLSGVTYNIYVSTTGVRDTGDYDRVYMKMVAGNLPVSIYGVAKFIRNTSQSSVTSNTTVLLNTTSANTISDYVSLNTSTGVITLQSGTYELNGSAGGGYGSSGFNGDSRSYSLFHNGTTYVGTGGVSETGPSGNWNAMPQNNANYIVVVPAGQTASMSFKVAIAVNVASISETGDFGAIGDAGRAWVVVRKYN
jgi:hypothetical protein